MKLEELEAICKNTAGYKEASNKESFITGLQVAYSKMNKNHEAIQVFYKSQSEQWEKEYNKVLADMKTLTGIIEKYSE